ncbi:uncharacterized protein B0I36DRAFT_313654 [Microdochium trichocladiopsis]|uniref:Uncharacterized protein n=1 Tax=Microdochium trichocladiopsis TaxID=1682393 RepID=A0A9P8YE81_9PEZI|nr:uncharacterized protein B0I36DRAFT_313654 [Microdochium trichocladiopsis]KAH7037267.1 hypothetical protein B0I36DRAFT_313654 [Microdochium trichocladiopsis]
MYRSQLGTNQIFDLMLHCSMRSRGELWSWRHLHKVPVRRTICNREGSGTVFSRVFRSQCRGQELSMARTEGRTSVSKRMVRGGREEVAGTTSAHALNW